jgi:hypothetical protein
VRSRRESSTPARFPIQLGEVYDSASVASIRQAAGGVRELGGATKDLGLSVRYVLREARAARVTGLAIRSPEVAQADG